MNFFESERMEFLDGVYTVLMTPFNEDETIDYESYKKLIDLQINSHVTGVVVLGTTSESPTLSRDEQTDLVKYVYKRIKDKGSDKKIIIGVGGNNTQDTSKFAYYNQEYCDYVMITVPSYNKPSQDGIYEHFKTVCQIVIDKPVILYNVPGRTGVNMLPETVAKIYENNANVCAIKEASGSISQIMDIISLCKIKVFAGDDGLTIPVASVGGTGVISVVSNIFPNEISNVYTYCVNNKYEEARIEYSKLYDLVKMLFIESNPVPGKEMLCKLGIFQNSKVRLPLTNLKEENKLKVLKVLLSKIGNIDNFLNNNL